MRPPTALPPAVLALSEMRQALAAHDFGTVFRLARAEADNRSPRALAADDTGDPQRDWSAWVNDAELDIMAGRCWTELRRPLRAVPLLVRGLTGFADAHARDKALYLTWLAEAYATAGEAEEAARVAVRAAELADGVASARPRQRIEHVVERLVLDHGEVPAVAELVDRTA